MTTIGKLSFDGVVMNAACSVVKTKADIEALAATSISVITVGSITVLPRDGNAEPRWYDVSDYALNSFGMPNGGLEAYRKLLPELVEIAHANNKLLSLSIAGFNTQEYAQLASLGAESSVDLLELNFGCPNVQVDGKQKPIASFDTDYMQEIIHEVSAVTTIPLMVKLSPYSNPAELQRVAAVITASGKIDAVVSSNTFPNGYHEENGAPSLIMEYGGVSGRAMLPISLGQVRQFRKALPDSIAVIGAGGIESKSDVNTFISAGASAVQAATLIVREGHAALERLI